MASRAQPGSDPLPADADGKALLSSSMRYKLRKKHPCPVELDQELKVKNARLPKPVHDGLNAWLKKHRDNPYPNKAEKETLSAKLGITPQQVSFISLFFIVRHRGKTRSPFVRRGGEREKGGRELGRVYDDPFVPGKEERGKGALPAWGRPGWRGLHGWVCSMGERAERGERGGDGGATGSRGGFFGSAAAA